MGMNIDGAKIVVSVFQRGGVDVEAFKDKKSMLINYAYHLSINEMKEVRKYLSNSIAIKKREGYKDDEGEIV